MILPIIIFSLSVDAASLPLDDLYLRECEAKNELTDESIAEARDRVLQQWFNDFLPTYNACGRDQQVAKDAR